MLKMLPPELAHKIGKWAMKRGLGGIADYNPRFAGLDGHRLSEMVDCPIGLAAGFDKNGEIVGRIWDYGFGWVEVGSVTAKGGPGNPKPRLFRVDDGCILNRMGLNGLPVEEVRENLKGYSRASFAINIAKTHSPDIMGDKAIEDIVHTYKTIGNRGLYTALNISCPNTAEGKTFEDPAALRELIAEIDKIRTPIPLYIKVSPDLSISRVYDIVHIFKDFQLDGVIACNTMPFEHPKHGKGGLSGPMVKRHSLNMVRTFRSKLPDTTIIGCGGISCGVDILEYEKAGANLFQAYSGFVRGPNSGSSFIRRVARQYRQARAVDIHNFKSAVNAKISKSV